MMPLVKRSIIQYAVVTTVWKELTDWLCDLISLVDALTRMAREGRLIHDP
jgi:hypothetical protein